MFTYLLGQWRLLSGHLAALERCVWALPMGHGEPPCPLASWARDIRPRVGLTPPGTGSPGDSAWLLTWPCPAVPSRNLVLPRAAHTWRTSTAFALLAAPPVFTSLQHPDCQDDQPKRCPGLQKRPPPGAPGSPWRRPPPLISGLTLPRLTRKRRPPAAPPSGSLARGLLSLPALPWAELSKVPEPSALPCATLGGGSPHLVPSRRCPHW